MRKQLLHNGYHFDVGSGIYVRKGYAGIDYSEGDAAEEALAVVIKSAQDRSLFSQELRTACVDWSSTYHLHPTRANILRPFEQFIQGRRVLEIGAGCGAITRYLGECGAQVIALEGSCRRAAIAAARTCDQDNVAVVAEDFNQFVYEGKFDVVTLIGVLEYAGLFTHTNTPEISLLNKARSLLAPGGVLILAIENQLGLKYFAGAPEDHIGKPMYGLENRYQSGQAKTFGRVQLEKTIRQAGFSQTEFFLPLPDYKLASAILTMAGLDEKSFDSSSLLRQNVWKDAQMPDQPLFSLERAWSPICDNELALDLANSFLVIASESAPTAVAADTLAWHFGTGRRLPFCKTLQFLRQADQSIQVKCLPVSTRHAYSDQTEILFVLEDLPYVAGQQLSDEFWRIVTTAGWTIKQIGDFLRRYLVCLNQILKREGHPQSISDSNDALPGLYLDAVPQNIIITTTNEAYFIDREWQTRQTINLGYLLFRSLLVPADMERKFARPAEAQHAYLADYILDSINAAGVGFTCQDLEHCIAREKKFQKIVAGDLFDQDQQRWHKATLLPGMITPLDDRRFSALYFRTADEEYSENRQLRQEYNAQSSELQVLRFTIPSLAQDVAFFRFDPIDYAGIVRLTSLQLHDPTGKSVWAWNFQADCIADSSGLLPFFRDAESVILWAVNDDPQIIFSVSQLTAATIGAGWTLAIGLENLTPHRLGYLLAERQLQISGLHEQIAAAETEILNRQAELTGIYRSRKWRLAEKLARIAKFFGVSG